MDILDLGVDMSRMKQNFCNIEVLDNTQKLIISDIHFGFSESFSIKTDSGLVAHSEYDKKGTRLLTDHGVYELTGHIFGNGSITLNNQIQLSWKREKTSFLSTITTYKGISGTNYYFVTEDEVRFSFYDENEKLALSIRNPKKIGNDREFFFIIAIGYQINVEMMGFIWLLLQYYVWYEFKSQPIM